MKRDEDKSIMRKSSAKSRREIMENKGETYWLNGREYKTMKELRAAKKALIEVTIKLDPNGMSEGNMEWFKAAVNSFAVELHITMGYRYSMPWKGISDWGHDTLDLKGWGTIKKNSYP